MLEQRVGSSPLSLSLSNWKLSVHQKEVASMQKQLRKSTSQCVRKRKRDKADLLPSCLVSIKKANNLLKKIGFNFLGKKRSVTRVNFFLFFFEKQCIQNTQQVDELYFPLKYAGSISNQSRLFFFFLSLCTFTVETGDIIKRIFYVVSFLVICQT